MTRLEKLTVGYLTVVVMGVGALGALAYSVSPAHTQVYTDGRDCMLTSNPPIAGLMTDGLCLPLAYSTGSATAMSPTIMIAPAPRPCPVGTEKVLVPGGVKCARGLVDPE